MKAETMAVYLEGLQIGKQNKQRRFPMDHREKKKHWNSVRNNADSLEQHSPIEISYEPHNIKFLVATLKKIKIGAINNAYCLF